jgi:hypothetical protein
VPKLNESRAGCTPPEFHRIDLFHATNREIRDPKDRADVKPIDDGATMSENRRQKEESFKLRDLRAPPFCTSPPYPGICLDLLSLYIYLYIFEAYSITQVEKDTRGKSFATSSTDKEHYAECEQVYVEASSCFLHFSSLG